MSALAVVTNPAELIPGRWYCIGMEDDEGAMQWGPIYRYEGREHHPACPEWYDDDGERVESLWDSFLRMPVSMDAADAYAMQGGAA